MSTQDKKTLNRERRHRRVRSKVFGTGATPRLSIFRSNRFIYAQLINDEAGKTLLSLSTKGLSGGTEKERAAELGKQIALGAKAAKISSVVFDRGGFIYTGKIKVLADSAREAGLKF